MALIAIKAFAFGASGAGAILATLVESVLVLAGLRGGTIALRGAAGREGGQAQAAKVMALASLVHAGLIFASAVFIGWEAVSRIFDPRAITGGSWAIAAVAISMAISLWLARAGTRERGAGLADLGAGLVVLVGVVSGAFLGAPALDAAAGLIVAIWLFWGAAGMLRPAAEQALGSRMDSAGPWAR